MTMAKNFNPETEQKEKEIKTTSLSPQINPQPQELIHNVWVLICLSDLKRAWNDSSQPIQVAQDIMWKVMGLHFH